MARASLFIVALPRSLSSLLYHAIRRALALREPKWTTDGEILNVRRFALLAAEGTVEGVKYLERHRDGRRFDQLLAFLDQVANGEGYAYKDVIQPFVVAEWLPASQARVLHLVRSVPDVAYSMLERGWHYPAQAAGIEPQTPAGSAADPERLLVAGLLRARQALDAVPGSRVHFDELIHHEAPLQAALSALYGDDLQGGPSYLDQEFCRVREEVLRRREAPRYRRLAALCEELEGS